MTEFDFKLWIQALMDVLSNYQLVVDNTAIGRVYTIKKKA